MTIREQLIQEKIVEIDNWLDESTRQQIMALMPQISWGVTYFKTNEGDRVEQDQDEVNNKAATFDKFPDELKNLTTSIKIRIAQMLGICGCKIQEGLINYYPTGSKIGMHYDSFDATLEDKAYTSNNNIEYTFLITLQAPISGGETNFPSLHTSIPQVNNKLIIWRNITIYDADGYGLRDYQMNHEGATVTAGEKYILVFFVKQR